MKSTNYIHLQDFKKVRSRKGRIIRRPIKGSPEGATKSPKKEKNNPANRTALIKGQHARAKKRREKGLRGTSVDAAPSRKTCK